MCNQIFKQPLQYLKHWLNSTRNFVCNIKNQLSHTKIIPAEYNHLPQVPLKLLYGRIMDSEFDNEFDTTLLKPLLKILVDDLTYKLYSMDPNDVFHILKLSMLVEPRGSSNSPWTDLQEMGKTYESCALYHHKMIPHIVHHCLGQCFINTKAILNNLPPVLNPGYPVKTAIQNVLRQLHALN